MSGFDVTLTVGRAEIATTNAEAIELGVSPSVQISIGVGQALPFSAGPGEPPLMVEMGTVRFSLEYDAAKAFFEEGLKQVNAMRKPSNLVAAQSLDEVENAAKALERIKTGS